jgi:hypothetical protein
MLQGHTNGHPLQTLTGFIVTQRSRGDIGKAQSLILRSNSITKNSSYLDQHYNPKIFYLQFQTDYEPFNSEC